MLIATLTNQDEPHQLCCNTIIYSREQNSSKVTWLGGSVFCPGFQKGRVPSEKGTLARWTDRQKGTLALWTDRQKGTLARWTEEKGHN